jgi:hypothetical protein
MQNEFKIKQHTLNQSRQIEALLKAEQNQSLIATMINQPPNLLI